MLRQTKERTSDTNKRDPEDSKSLYTDKGGT